MIGVTITGLDDHVDLHDLYVETERHPYTEWGVLLSASRMGTARYPMIGRRAGAARPERPSRTSSSALCAYATSPAYERCESDRARPFRPFALPRLDA